MPASACRSIHAAAALCPPAPRTGGPVSKAPASVLEPAALALARLRGPHAAHPRRWKEAPTASGVALFVRRVTAWLAALASLTLLVGCDGSAESADLPSNGGEETDTGASTNACETQLGSGWDLPGLGSSQRGGQGLCETAGLAPDRCPVAPRGRLPAECASGRIFEGSGFQQGTGPCTPALANWACPAGWLARSAFADGSGVEDLPDGVAPFTICEPPENPPDMGASPRLSELRCPDGEIGLPQDASCRPLGSPCPADGERWASEANLRALAPGYDGPIVYVAPDAAADGAGTRLSPRPWSAAAGVAAEGGVLALALGDYRVGMQIDRRVAVLGACVSGTRISTTQPIIDATTGILSIASSSPVLVRDLSLTGSRPGIAVRGVGGAHLIRAINIQRAQGHGMYVEGPGSVDVDGLVIASTQPLADGRFGRGIEATSGAALAIRNAAVLANRQVGLVAFGATTSVTAERLVVEDTTSELSTGTNGYGILAQSGSRMVVREVTLRRNAGAGLIAVGSGTQVEADDLWVEDTQPRQSDSQEGWGVQVSGGATASLRRATLLRNHGVGLIVDGDGSRAEAEATLIEQTQPRASDRSLGLGMAAEDGASLILRNVALRGNRDVGLVAIGARTVVDAERLVVEDTRADLTGQSGGQGIGVVAGARLQVRNAALRRNTTAGIQASDDGTTVTAIGLLVEDTEVSPLLDIGTGVRVLGGASMTVDEAVIRRSRGFGMEAWASSSQPSDRTLLVASRVVVDDTRADRFGGNGDGVRAESGASVQLRDAIIRASRQFGIYARDASTELVAASLLVERTLPVENSGELGIGVAVFQGARVSMSDAALRRNRAFGLAVVSSGFDLTNGGLLDDPIPSRAEAARLLISDTDANLNNQQAGLGVLVADGGVLTVTDATMERNRESGIEVNAGCMGLRRVAVLQTRSSLLDGRFGDGLLLFGSSTLRGGDLTLWESARCGLLVAGEGADVALSGAILGRNLFGLSLLSTDLTPAKLGTALRREVYFENSVDLSTDSLEIPDPFDALESLDSRSQADASVP